MEAGGIRVVIHAASQYTENVRLQENVLKLVHECAAASGKMLFEFTLTLLHIHAC